MPAQPQPAVPAKSSKSDLSILEESLAVSKKSSAVKMAASTGAAAVANPNNDPTKYDLVPRALSSTLSNKATNASFGMDLRLERPFAKEVYAKLAKFIEEEVLPAELVLHRELAACKGAERWNAGQNSETMEKLKASAKEKVLIGSLFKNADIEEEMCGRRGLWNLFLPSVGKLTNLEYGYCAELMGRFLHASEACNCSAPDTGNMEVIEKYGNAEQKKQWLEPLLEGKIRSVFLMTEPAVASSDATNIECKIRPDGDDYLINGVKWWSSGACDARCKIGILLGKVKSYWFYGIPDLSKLFTKVDGWEKQPLHKRQSMILIPMDTPGVKVERPLTVFGYDDAPHGHAEVSLTNVRVPKSCMILGEGRGFEIAQGRLGPGRIHHCMRAIGLGERSLESMLTRSKERVAFGRPIATYNLERIAQTRIELDQLRLLVLTAAKKIDEFGVKAARKDVAMIKVIVPKTVCEIIDRAIQIHGGRGVCQDVFLPYAYAGMRTLRLADGPDEVHAMSIGKMELKEHEKRQSKM